MFLEFLSEPKIDLKTRVRLAYRIRENQCSFNVKVSRCIRIVFLSGWDQKCDVWSVGCIIFELAMGYMMFDTHSSQVS